MSSPANPEVLTLFFEGCELMAAGNLPDAKRCFEQALQIDPSCAEALANLGLLLEKQGDEVAAEACYRRSIAFAPGHPEAHLNLGALLARHKHFGEAEAELKCAIDLKPHAAEAWTDLGVLYACTGREAEAERCHRTAIFIDPALDIASFNLSYLLLIQGRFEEGWQRFEHRSWYAGIESYLQMPRWRGEELAGKSLLICFEMGMGDMIQFCRYVTVLKDMGAGPITLVCHPPLKSLLATLAGIDAVLDYNEPLAPAGWDYWTPLLSTPGLCDTRLENIPAKTPYLYARPELVEKWRKLLPRDFRVGLVWRGNPLFENDQDRSLPSVATLAPLWEVAGASFIGLQKGCGEDETPPGGLPFMRLGGGLEDFADTAALIDCLDLVICVDTAVAHLTGALGKPCWVMLPAYKPDWRWLQDRTDTPWYPHAMTLYRQQTMGDWQPVIAKIAADLDALIRSLPARA